MDYLQPFQPRPPSPEDKVLYDKCKQLIEKVIADHKPILITSTFRSRSPEMDAYLADEKLKGLERMHITGKQHASVDDIILSVLRTEKAIQEGKLRTAPKAVKHIPESVEIIMLKTRLGDNNGI